MPKVDKTALRNRLPEGVDMNRHDPSALVEALRRHALTASPVPEPKRGWLRDRT